MRSQRSLALGAATNCAAFAATLLVSFFLAPYLIRSLGDARYGVWCIVEAIAAYFTLFDLGIAACLVRFVARHQRIAHAREGRHATAPEQALGAGADAAPLHRYADVRLAEGQQLDLFEDEASRLSEDDGGGSHSSLVSGITAGGATM